MTVRSSPRLVSVLLYGAFVVSILPLPVQAREDSFAEERRRNRERAEEERRNAERREQEAQRRISAGKNQGEEDLAKIDRWIQISRAALNSANRTAKEWADARSRDVPPEIIDQGKRFYARLTRIERTRAECGTQLHSPGYVVSETLRRIADLDSEARTVAQEGNQLCLTVQGLYVGEGQDILRGVEDSLKASFASISQAKDRLHRMTLQELEEARNRLQKARAEAEKAEKRARLSSGEKMTAAESRASYRAERNTYLAQEQLRQESWDLEKVKSSVDDQIDELESRCRKLSDRRESCGRRLAKTNGDESGLFDTSRRSSRWGERQETPDWDGAIRGLVAEMESIKALKTEVEAFNLDVAALEKRMAVLTGKPDSGAKTKTASSSSRTTDDDTEPSVVANDPETPKRRSGARFIYFWSPWDGSDALSATRR